MTNHALPASSVRPERAQILISVLGLAVACWLMSIAQMSGMGAMGSMGTATNLGPFVRFFPLWMTMMAAMMLPGTAAALLKQDRTRAAPKFLLSYLGILAVTGIFAYAAYRPHGRTAAGTIVLAAGLYELTPLKRRCRERCRHGNDSGTAFGVACLGSSIGLMAVLFAISPMSISLMAAMTAILTAQKWFPAAWPVDIPLALTVAAGGLWILA